MREKYIILLSSTAVKGICGLLLSISVHASPGDTSTPIWSKTSAPWVGDTLWGAPCRGKSQGFGPLDYTMRSQFAGSLALVEGSHFPPQVENLISGNRGTLTGDLDYTLRAWPNHHRALNSAIRLRLRNKENFPITNPRDTPAECYLQRAIYFNPNDGVSHMLYGMLLQKMGNSQEALAEYQSAERLDPNNIQIKYNMGLLLVELEQFDQAKKYALDVYSQNFPLPGLKRQLKELGHWDGE